MIYQGELRNGLVYIEGVAVDLDEWASRTRSRILIQLFDNAFLTNLMERYMKDGHTHNEFRQSNAYDILQYYYSDDDSDVEWDGVAGAFLSQIPYTRNLHCAYDIYGETYFFARDASKQDLKFLCDSFGKEHIENIRAICEVGSIL